MSLVDYTIQARYFQRAVLPRRAQQRAGTKGNSNRTERAEIHHTKGRNPVRLPSFSGHPISADLVSVREDVHCESTTPEIHT